MTQDERPLMVTIHCITYNQEPYIRQCLEGIVMQKTTFRFEAVVHDDASTDGTADIIREYAEKYSDIIKPIIETENQYSKHDGSLDRIMNDHTHGKYVALCEGDDYWIDENKLQEQVDFLDNHSEYGLVYGKVNIYSQDKQQISGIGGSLVSDYKDLLLNGNHIPTVTVMIRSSLYKKYREEVGYHNWRMGDYPLWLYVANFSKIHFEDKIFAVYRVLKSSASHFNGYDQHEKFENSLYEIQIFFAQKYGITKEEEKYLMVQHNSRLFRIAYQYNNKKKVKEFYHVVRSKGVKIHIKYLLSFLHLNSFIR